MVQPQDLNVPTPQTETPSEAPSKTTVLARDDTVVWPEAFHPEPQTTIPDRAHRHPRFRAKPKEMEAKRDPDPYAYMLVCPACESVLDSVKCKLVCPNCHAIVQTCCD